MRKFVPGGPEIPYSVLQAHEEERLVFFCGAGISRYTGLPGFPELVRETFKACGTPLSKDHQSAKNAEDEAFHGGRLDQALHLLEKKVGREVSRPQAIKILSRPLKRGSGHLTLHKTLLDLSEISTGGYHLVTTNFDNRFSKARPNTDFTSEAPRIGWPRIGAWRHLTYLHGLIRPHDFNGEDLILSSADFGRAYLTEGWASRFLVELFREYTVLFVGYSLNDPVLRYMVDALATDTREGRFREPFVLAPYNEHGRKAQEEGWKAKGVTPIGFSTGADGRDFSLQDGTLTRWAEQHREGMNSRIAVALGSTRTPYVRSPDDADLRNVAWALSKGDGSIAKAFADAVPPPDISWLEPLSSIEIPSAPKRANVKLFELPSPPPVVDKAEGYHVAPLSGLYASYLPGLPLNVVSFHLGRWLAKHLDKQELVDWVTDRMGIIHLSLHPLLTANLNDTPEPWRSFWNLIASGQTVPPCDRNNLQHRRPFRRGEWPPDAESSVLDACNSWVQPERPYSQGRNSEPPARMPEIARFRLKVSHSELIESILENSQAPEIRHGLSLIVDPITSKLASAVELGKQAEVYDVDVRTSLGLRVLHERTERRPARDWTSLVYLTIEAFRALNEEAPNEAETVAARWRYLATHRSLRLFARLSLIAFAEGHRFSSARATDFLLTQHGAVFWDRDNWAEIARLIDDKSAEFSDEDQQRLAAAVGDGPSRDLFPDFSGTDAEYQEIADSLRLRVASKLLSAGFPISDEIQTQLEAQRAEFKGAEEPTAHRTIAAGWQAPANAEELLTKTPEQICEILADEDGFDAGHRLADLIEKDFGLGLRVLPMLIPKDVSSSIWEIGFGALSKESLAENLGRAFDALLLLARGNPDWVGGAGVRALSRFLYSFGETTGAFRSINEAEFLELWDLAFAGAEANGATTLVDPADPIVEAINAPGGDLAKALIDLIYVRELKVGSALPEDLRIRFDRMWNGNTDTNRHARTIIASRVLPLHRLDPVWAAENIVNAMTTDSEEALSLWVAMLWSAQWDVELLDALQPGLQRLIPRMRVGPETFPGRLSEWVASILILAPDALSDDTIISFFQFANSDELGSVTWVFSQLLDDAGEKAPELWTSKIKRVFENFWPADIDKKSPALSEALLAMSMKTREAFDDVISSLIQKGLIVPESEGYWLMNCAIEADEDENTYDYAGNHPEALLQALNVAINENLAHWNREHLVSVLDRIIAAAAHLAEDPRVRRLRAISVQG